MRFSLFTIPTFASGNRRRVTAVARSIFMSGKEGLVRVLPCTIGSVVVHENERRWATYHITDYLIFVKLLAEKRSFLKKKLKKWKSVQLSADEPFSFER